MANNGKKLVSLEELKIDIRQAWAREDDDFTPWLAKNINALGEVLGLRLTAKQTEAPVGDFYLDLLAETDDGRCVAVENQFNQTDHDHLGKCLTYAAGFRADIIIWVTETVRDEHRRAARYFNETNSNVKFYVVVVEVFQIDDSHIAYQFCPFVDSGDWVRLHSNFRHQIYGQYHAKLRKKLEDDGFSWSFTHDRNWSYDCQAGFLLDDTAGEVGCYHRVGDVKNLYVGVWCKDKQITEALEKHKGEMEKEIGDTLEWGAGDFCVSRPAPPPAELDSFLPKSVELLRKFEKFIFPRVRKAMAEIKKQSADGG